MRKTVIAGNWKMNITPEGVADLIEGIEGAASAADAREVVVCVPFIDLQDALITAEETRVHVGAQNMHFEDSGAYTGEISGQMLDSIGVEYVIIGHSERREYFNETDETVNKKIKAALRNNLKPIVCVGETLEEYEKGLTKDKIVGQIEKAFDGLDKEDMGKIIIAYEPIWAIGTGKTATPEIAENCLLEIRNKIKELFGDSVAFDISILYGGSVKASNISELLDQEDIDGVLVGGASLKADEFSKIILG